MLNLSGNVWKIGNGEGRKESLKSYSQTDNKLTRYINWMVSK